MTDDDTKAVLEGLGISVPAADLPFLRRARQRQRELLNQWSAEIPSDAEPAMVFKPEVGSAGG
jgi:hypothetical protein